MAIPDDVLLGHHDLLGEHLRQVIVAPRDPEERSAISAARVIPFPQTARSHAKQMETRSMAILLEGLLALLIAVAVGVCLGRRWQRSRLSQGNTRDQ